jgi:hypothetical protein
VNEIGAAFLLVSCVLCMVVPRRYAPLPLLLSALYMTDAQQLVVGGAHFTIPRLLIAVGLLRACVRGEWVHGKLLTMDYLVFVWGITLIALTPFHVESVWVYRLGIAWTELGTYVLLRIWLQDIDDVRFLARALIMVLLPLACLMLIERGTGANPFAVVGGLETAVRDGSVRAAGPFSHAILAGTVGAVCVALALGLWPASRALSVVGCVAGAAMVYASTSSGPILMVAFILLGHACWLVRDHMRLLRFLAVLAFAGLVLSMQAPVYYLIARIEVFGGSQGWFRARLIESAIDHLGDWWLVGTDYTRHWMATGIAANEQHTDMTNHILSMGVMGGLPLILVFGLIIVTSFRNVGHALRRHAAATTKDLVLVWSLGATLFGLVVNFMSITLFDQSVIFFWLIVASIAAAVAPVRSAGPTVSPAESLGVSTSTGAGIPPRRYAHD